MFGFDVVCRGIDRELGGKMTKAWDIVAYQYEADFHCVPCATARWGEHLADENTRDEEGNPIHPVFETDEVNLCGESCGDCYEWAIAPEEHEPAACLLGSGCRQYEAAD